jgi:hypothetical protein
MDVFCLATTTLTLPAVLSFGLGFWYRFLQSWDLDLLMDVLRIPLTRESHSRGVRLKEFEAHQGLSDFYNPLSLSVDREGRVRNMIMFYL